MTEPTPPPPPPQHTVQRDLDYLQHIIHTQQENINWATHEVRRSNLLVHKMSEALVNIKQFSQNSMRPLNERTCKHKDCKAVQERLERTLRSIIDLVNHSLQPN